MFQISLSPAWRHCPPGYFTDIVCNLSLTKFLEETNFLLNQYFSYLEMYQNQTDRDLHLVFYYCRQKSSTFYFTDLLACNLMVWPSSLDILPYSVTQSVLPILEDVPKSNWWSLTPSFWGFWIEIINFLFSRPSF